MANNFEQLANEVLPGSFWCSAHCLQSVEFELNKIQLETLIDSWGDAPTEILSNMHAHFKQEKAAVAYLSKSPAGERFVRTLLLVRKHDFKGAHGLIVSSELNL